jgi:hypothetical protein
MPGSDCSASSSVLALRSSIVSASTVRVVATRSATRSSLVT